MWLERAKELFLENYPISLIFCIACGALLIGTFNLTLLLVLAIRRRKLRNAERKRAYFRRLQYALPERENGYVRQRLHTALKPEVDEAESEPTAEMSYAKELLLRVQNADLSKAERWEVEELRRILQAYEEKSRWSKMDCRGVSDAFSHLMKLAGKYAV